MPESFTALVSTRHSVLSTAGTPSRWRTRRPSASIAHVATGGALTRARCSSAVNGTSWVAYVIVALARNT